MTKAETQLLMDTMRRYYPFARQLRGTEAVDDFYRAMKNISYYKAKNALAEYAQENAYPPPVFDLIDRCGAAKKKTDPDISQAAAGQAAAGQAAAGKNKWMKDYIRRDRP